MKNMKVSAKLILSFLIVAFFAAATGFVGIFGMSTIETSGQNMYEEELIPLPLIGDAKETIQRMRVYVREMTMASLLDEPDGVETAFNTITGLIPKMDGLLEEYRATLKDDEVIRVFEEAESLYKNDLTQTVLRIHDASKIQDIDAIKESFIVCRDVSNIILENFDILLAEKLDEAAQAARDSEDLSRSLLITIIVVLALALAVAIFFALYISGLISKPLIVFTAFMKKAGSTGDISLNPADVETIQKIGKQKDELGECIAGAASFIMHVTNIAKELEIIAGGDLTVDVKMLSDLDTMGLSLRNVLESLNNMFNEINSSTRQVSVGAKQISDGAQSLAQGSTEQAASVEQLSGSIAEIAGKTKENAQMAEKAASLAFDIMNNAEKGSKQMEEMMSAVSDINTASQNIGKVIKVIDDIAFQTNILALNAAVEAARAGQHGKGFAVVAEEVRNLAAKSAEAAKETGEMIQNSIEKAALGSRIAGETAESLTEIVSGINESSALINDIAKSSEEQSVGISQINLGIDQVAQVIQQNSATAQQSAASSEEMSGQSDMLEEMISRFKLKR